MKLNRFTPSQLTRVSDFDEWLRHPFAGFPSVAHLIGSLPEFLTPAVLNRIPADVLEDQDAYYAQFEIPGIRKEDVKVELHDQLLSLTATKKSSGETESSTTLTRTISVPLGVASDHISAKLEDGILLVTLPKSSERKPKTVEIL